MSETLLTLSKRQCIHLLQDFEAPVERVFNFFSTHERLAEVYPAAFKLIKYGDDPRDANSLNSIRRITAFPLIIEETVTGYLPPKFIEYKVTYGFGLNNHVGRMNFIDLGGARCRLDYTIEFEPAIPLSGFLIRNLLQKLISNGVGEAARKFKADPNF
jgi:uncharacterized membrane protein